MKAVIIGAGKIGRGLIAGICRTSGIPYCFVEENLDLIREFRRRTEYMLHILGQTEQCISMPVMPIFHTSEEKEIRQELLETDLIFTAVGGKNLKRVGEFLGRQLEQVLPERKWSEPLNIIVHENWKYTDRDLRESIYKYLGEENKNLFLEMVGISMALSMGVSTMPPSEESRVREPLGIWMQDQWNVFVNKAGYKGNLPKIKGIGFVDQFLQLENQALYTNNASSAVISYVGRLKGYQYVAEAARDPQIEKLLDEAYEEIETALVRQLHVFPNDQKEFARRAREKYRDERIYDTVERHGRDPIRKLGPEERLLAPARMALESGRQPKALASAIAAALYYENGEDESACALRDLRREKGARTVLREICKLKAGDLLEELILEQINWLKSFVRVED